MRSVAARFWSHVARHPSGCWLWRGALAAGTGYGVFNRGDRIIGAHCFAWEQAHPGESRAGKVVRHDCDVPACVNPRHLRLGTHAENTADMDARGRRGHNPRRGEAHPSSKLTEASVLAARERHVAGASVTTLASELGVARSTMHAALVGSTWGDARGTSETPPGRNQNHPLAGES